MRTPQPTRRPLALDRGLVEAELRASADPTVMLAFWLVGFEEGAAEQSGEICVVELFGHAVGPRESELSLGVKAHHDPRLTDDMTRPRLPMDATSWHTYSAAWDREVVRLYVDDAPVHVVHQRLDYPMLLLVSLFEFPPGGRRNPASYPKTGHVRTVRAYH